MNRFAAEILRLGAAALGSAIFGAGVGFLQGEIAARGDDKLYQVAFAGGAAMVGAVIAFFLGPVLLYAVNRRMTFVSFCYIGVVSSVIGCSSAWLLSLAQGDRGWESMFVTPLAATALSVLFGRERGSTDASAQG